MTIINDRRASTEVISKRDRRLRVLLGVISEANSWSQCDISLSDEDAATLAEKCLDALLELEKSEPPLVVARFPPPPDNVIIPDVATSLPKRTDKY